MERQHSPDAHQRDEINQLSYPSRANPNDYPATICVVENNFIAL